jgi:hypothetical protein
MVSLENCILARDFIRNLAAAQEFTRVSMNPNLRDWRDPGTPLRINLTLQPGITLSGFAQDTKGAPVTNAMVNLQFGRFALEPRPLHVSAQGYFSIPALPQGLSSAFSLRITAKGYGSGDGYLEGKNTHTSHYEFPTFVLKTPDRKLAGQVVGSDKMPVAGVWVRISGPGQPQWDFSTKTDDQGHFAFDGLCEGPLNTILNGTLGVKVLSGDTNLVLQLGRLDNQFYDH